MTVNWDDMRYFLAVFRKNSFVGAAEELRVTHTTVARRISSLEEALQTTLYTRSEKGCRLTPAGEKLVAYAEGVESAVISAEETVSGSNKELTGAIRIGAPDGIGNLYLARCLGRLQKIHPSLAVELIAVPMYYSLSKREIDILITVRRPPSGKIVARKLTSYRLGLFATDEYLIRSPRITTASDLKKHSIIGYIDDLLFDRDLQFMEEIYPGLTPRFRSTTVVAQLQAVSAGTGVGVIPYFMAYHESKLIPVLQEVHLERGYWLQVNPDSRQLARVRTTIDFLVQQTVLDSDLFHTLPRRP